MRSSTSSEGPQFSAVCTNKGGHRDAFSNQQRKAPRISRGQQATEPRAKRETRSVLCHSLVVDSTERGRHHCSGEFKQLLLT